MQSIQVLLHDNKTFTIQMETYDEVLITSMLNNNQLTVVNIGKLILSRNTIKAIYPVVIEETA